MHHHVWCHIGLFGKGLPVFWNSLSKLGWLASKRSDLPVLVASLMLAHYTWLLFQMLVLGNKLGLHDGKASKHFIDIDIISLFLKVL